MVVLDKDGLAVESQKVTVYDYCPETGEFRGAFEWQLEEGMGLPAHATLTLPPPIGHGKQALYKNGVWELVDDFRNCSMFSITTGELFPVYQLGPIPEGFTLAEPTSIFDEFRNGKWIRNREKEKEHVIQTNQQKRKELLLDANLVIDGTQDFIDSGESPEEIVRMHKAWRNYRARLFLVSLPDPLWPSLPSQNVADYIVEPKEAEKDGATEEEPEESTIEPQTASEEGEKIDTPAAPE